MITTILFDLDGTLLPMDQDRFLESYLGRMAAKLAPHGYDPKMLTKAIWTGTAAMVKNDGRETNETVFWKSFEAIYGPGSRKDEPLFEEFYHTDFQKVQEACGFAPEAAGLIRELTARGFRVALATNPLFPAIATHSRIRWAGLDPADFELVTTYENSRHCKPNPAYYQSVLDALCAAPDECLMVGNDAAEDTAAESLGIRVFLLTDCLINKDGRDVSAYPQGSFPQLLDYIRRDI